MHGWTVLAHPLFIEQLERLTKAAAREQRAKRAGKDGPNTKLLAAIRHLAFEVIPRNPTDKAFRQGHSLGAQHTHWFRAKTGNGRYRLFFRYHSALRIIVLAWVNDRDSLRTRGSRTDAYTVFAQMLASGNPPDNWDALVRAAAKVGENDATC